MLYFKITRIKRYIYKSEILLTVLILKFLDECTRVHESQNVLLKQSQDMSRNILSRLMYNLRENERVYAEGHYAVASLW